MRLDPSASGVYPIAPTPFTPDGHVDEGSIDRLIDAYRAAGATGVTVLGIMGEAPKLEPEESLRIASRASRRCARSPGPSWTGVPRAS